MTIDEYLHICRNKRIYADNLRDKYLTLETKATSPARPNLETPGSRTRSGRDSLYLKLIEAKEKTDLALLDYVKARQDLFDKINQLPTDPGTALYIRYILELKDNEALEAWNFYSCGKEICRKTYYRYLKTGKELLKEILNRNGVIIE